MCRTCIALAIGVETSTTSAICLSSYDDLRAALLLSQRALSFFSSLLATVRRLASSWRVSSSVEVIRAADPDVFLFDGDCLLIRRRLWLLLICFAADFASASFCCRFVSLLLLLLLIRIDVAVLLLLRFAVAVDSFAAAAAESLLLLSSSFDGIAWCLIVRWTFSLPLLRRH